jgi:hypothetical protein
LMGAKSKASSVASSVDALQMNPEARLAGIKSV